jgi:tripartite ATP-independent transporter DctM subunit
MLAGNLMNEGGITPDLVRFARLLLGHIRAGLGLATILACAIFSAISGAAVATAVAIGVVMIPAMKAAGYDEDVGAAMTCVASCMGPIIPPSIPFIIYGVTANVSIGALVFGRRVPGAPAGRRPDALHVLRGGQARLPVRPQDAGQGGPGRAGRRCRPFHAVLIMGGILSGMFTPTEAAGVTVIYAVLVGTLVYRS